MNTLKFWFTLVGITILLIVVGKPIATQGAKPIDTPTSEPRATITPIPRSTVSPMPTKTVNPITPSPDTTGVSNKIGGHIELHLTPSQQIYWTEVEWQDITGGWHVVNGWRGYSILGAVRWFVNEQDFYKGPFRWVVYSQNRDRLIVFSSSFQLPGYLSETVIVDIRVSD